MDKLEMLGNMLQQAQNDYDQLPNQHTKGFLDGIARQYTQAIQELQQPSRTQNEPDYGQNLGQQPMQKYGVPAKKPTPAVTELVNIQGVLADILAELKALNSRTSAEAQRLFDIEQKTRILDDVETEADDFDEEDDASEHTDAGHQNWNKSFGQRMQGNATQSAPYGSRERLQQLAEEQNNRQIPQEVKVAQYPAEVSYEAEKQAYEQYVAPPEEDYMDPESGHAGKMRRIGRTVNVDDEPQQPQKKSVAEWDKTRGNQPYTTQGDDYGLEDLQPGQ